MQYGKSFCLGVEARNPSFVWNTKTTKEKMEWFLVLRQSYSFIPNFVALSKRKKDLDNLVAQHRGLFYYLLGKRTP